MVEMGPLPAGLRWVAFDLDDTLHRFTHASGRAAEAVFAEIQRRQGIPADRLRHAYGVILRGAQSAGFTLDRTAREYRGERFAALLDELGRSSDGERGLDRLLGVYDAALGEELELRAGAAEALRAARRAGLSTMVISEGPADAQSTTIERLGIAPMVDILVTTAAEEVSKSDGLFEIALTRAGCGPEEMLYVGDSVERDIAPALALGIAAVYVGEEGPPAGQEAIRTDLAELGRLLERLRPTDGR
jgi:putative hydrolase of the HAD superfamily